MDRVQLKKQAKEQIRGKIGILFVITLIIALISFAAMFILSFIPFVGSLAASIIVTPAFALSLARIYINVVGGKNASVNDTFSGFDDFWSAFKVTFLVGLFTFLWSLLFIIPGIIKAYSYSMSLYVLAENKGMPALEAIDRSKKMTEGHKMELFVLELSFIGWMLLVGITFGLAGIYVIPYMYATEVNYYNEMKGAVKAAPTASAAPAPEVIDEPKTDSDTPDAE